MVLALPMPGTDGDQSGITFFYVRVRHICPEVGTRRLHCINLLCVYTLRRLDRFIGCGYVG